MAAGPIPRGRIERSGEVPTGPMVDIALYCNTGMASMYGATAMPSMRLGAGEQGLENSFTVSPSVTNEWAPANPRQDEAELQRIRAEAMARQSAVADRARALLVEVIGEPAVQTLEAGGTYMVPSTRWPGTEYHIPKLGYIKIVKGGLWQDVCLVSSDMGLPWADVVLSRIKMIEANETIVQGRGIRQGGSPNRTLSQLRAALEKLMTPTRRREP